MKSTDIFNSKRHNTEGTSVASPEYQTSKYSNIYRLPLPVQKLWHPALRSKQRQLHYTVHFLQTHLHLITETTVAATVCTYFIKSIYINTPNLTVLTTVAATVCKYFLMSIYRNTSISQFKLEWKPQFANIWLCLFIETH